jgi:hypothetical protein
VAEPGRGLIALAVSGECAWHEADGNVVAKVACSWPDSSFAPSGARKERQYCILMRNVGEECCGLYLFSSATIHHPADMIESRQILSWNS